MEATPKQTPGVCFMDTGPSTEVKPWQSSGREKPQGPEVPERDQGDPQPQPKRQTPSNGEKLYFILQTCDRPIANKHGDIGNNTVFGDN